MKKSLALLLTLILTFSSISILSVGTVSAETQKVGQVILESDFNDADGTNWQGTQQNVTFGDDNGDSVNDYASVKIGTKNGAGLVSSPFNLIPGNEYELTYYIRVPEESVSFKIGDIFYAPTTAFYQPKVNSTGTKVSSIPAVSTVEAENNYYAYSYTDADETKSWVRREGFTSTWTIDGYAAKNKTTFSNFDYRDYKAVLSATNTDLNAAFANWTKVTVNFTAMAAVEGETSQVTALAFTFDSLKSSDKNYVFDLKDVKLVCTNDGTVTKPIMQSDFNDADGTNWQMSTGAVTYSDDNGDGVNDYASVKISSTSSGVGLFSAPFNLVPGNEYELTYYIRVPEGSESFKIGDIFYAPTVAFYQPKVNDAGTKVSSVPAVSTVEASNNYYAYSYTDSADATKSWARREGFASTWTIDGYAARNTNNFSNFDYRDYKAVLSATNADINAAFANWTKVTVNFTALAAAEGETSQVTALAFTFQDLKSEKNYMFDIKDVTLTETSLQSETPETPEIVACGAAGAFGIAGYFGISSGITISGVSGVSD